MIVVIVDSRGRRCHGDPACFYPSPVQYGVCLPRHGTQRTTTDAEVTPNGFKRMPYNPMARRDRRLGHLSASTFR
jgi:hypothetical protein